MPQVDANARSGEVWITQDRNDAHWNAESCAALVLPILWSYYSTAYCRLKRTQPDPKTKAQHLTLLFHMVPITK